MAPTRVTASEFAALEGLDDWRFLLGAISADFVASSFGAGATLAASIGAAADEADHHPDLDVRWPGRVRVRLTTHSAGGLTDNDVAMARRISELAARAGATPETGTLQSLEVAIDTMDASRIKPFWAAVLGYREGENEVTDPSGFGPAFWFQQVEEPRTERQRFHIDVTVPHDAAEARVAAALAAGGRLVTDRFARMWWVLADADGNEACVCTWQDRA